MRSWLFVPASNAKKLERLTSLDADVVVLDIAGTDEDERPQVREAIADWLADNPRGSGSGFARWVRIDGVGSRHWKQDLAAVIAGQPDGIVLGDANDADHPKQLAAELWELEQSTRVPHGTVHILAQVATSAAGTHSIEAFAKDPPPRLTGLGWDARALAAALGAQNYIDERARYVGPFDHVRSRVLLAARARGLMAVETPWLRWREAELTAAAAGAARQHGFTGMAVVHPRQIDAINSAFAPSAAERDEARGIIKLFEDNPEASAILYDGRMIDRPQLEHARRIAEQT